MVKVIKDFPNIPEKEIILKKLNYNKFKVIVLVRNIKIAKKLKNRSTDFIKFDLNKPKKVKY